MELVDRGLVLTANHVDLGKALLAAAAHVGQVGTSLEGTAHYLEVGNLTDVGLNRSLEEVDADGAVLVKGNLVTVVVLGSGHLGHVGNDDAHDLEHAVGTDIALSAYQYNGEDAAVNHTQADTLDGLLLGQGHLVEELHHQLLIVLGSHLEQSHAVLLGLVGECAVDVGNGSLATVLGPSVLLHGQHVNHAVEAGACIHGELEGNNLVAVGLAQLVIYVVKVAFLVLEAVDDKHQGLANALHGAEVVLCTYLDTIASVNDQSGGIGNAQSGNGVAYEVVTTRAVKEVELLAVLLSKENGRGNRVTILFLNGGIVAYGVTAVNGTPAADCAALKQDRLGESGLASALATDESDVFDLVCFVNLH